MKNIDFKKLLVLIVIIAILVLAILGTTKLIKGIGGPSKKVQEQIEENITKYFAKATIGHSTIYNGIDLLYDNEKFEAKDINKGSMIELAIKYAEENKIDLTVDNDFATKWTEQYFSKATGYNSKKIIEIVKNLFDVELEEKDLLAENNYLYHYYFVEGTILKVETGIPDIASKDSSLEFHPIQTKKDGKDTFKTRIAVAFVYNTGSGCSFAKDKNGTKIIETEVEEGKFPTEKTEEFTIYEFTTKKVGDNYVFVSAEEVK